MLVNENVDTDNICVRELTMSEFSDKIEKFDLILGLDEYDGCSQLRYYDITWRDNSISIHFAIINRYLGIHPQIEVFQGKIIVGNNNALSIIDIGAKSVKEYPIFIFYQFIICRELIIAVGELAVFCLKNEEVLWIKEDFEDIIDIDNFANNVLTLVTYENRKEICIDVNTGKIIQS